MKFYRLTAACQQIPRAIHEGRWNRLYGHRKIALVIGVAAGLIGPGAIYAQVPQDGQAVTNRLTTPYGGAWIPGNLGGHWWQSDNALGVCRLDPAPAGVTPPFQTSSVANACSTVAKAGGQIVVTNPAPGFPGLPAGAKFMFVPDASSKSNAVVRFVIDPATETIKSSSTFTVTPPSNVGGGTTGARAVALALAPNGLDLYVGYIKSGDIMKITNATVSGNPTFAKIGSTFDGKGVNSMTMFANASGTQDLYLAELGGNGLSYIPDPSGQKRAPCSPSAPCTAGHAGLPSGIPSNPAGLAADSSSIYIGDSPLNGTPGLGVVQWNVATGATSTYSNNINPAYDGSDGVNTNHYTQYANPVGLAFRPDTGDLYVGDDPGFRCAAPCVPPTGQGHLWKVAALAAAPTVTALSPNTGVPEGGTAVTITGTGFSTASGATTVAFGGGTPIVATCSTNKQCTVASPSGTATTNVDVTVTVGGQTSAITAADQFTYQRVTVTSISPSAGPASGGTTVTINGGGFSTTTNATRVSFGGVASTSVSCASSTQCTAVSPGPAAAGAVDVTVTVSTLTTSDTSTVNPAVDQFTYLGNTAPFVTSLCVVTDARNLTGGCTGVTGSTAGGTVVKLTGGNLTAATSINFGVNAAGSLGCTPDGLTCTVVTPQSPIGAGNVNVTVTAGGQTSVGVPFTYVTPSATVWAFGITAPKGGMLWVPNNNGGGHWWSSDHANGFCRQDTSPNPTAAPFAMNYGVCDDGSIGSPGQAVYDPSTATCQAGAAGPCHYIYVPDNAVKSTAVWRLTFDSATETIVGAPEAMLPLADVRTLKPNGMALGPGPNGTALYVTDLTEANIRRLDGPAGDPRSQTLTIVGTTGDGRGANGTIGFINNILYISENRSASWLDVTQCTDNSATPCSSTNATSNGAGRTGTLPLPSGVFIAGVATDPVHNLVYAADSPGGAAATIWRWNATPALSGVSPTSLVYLQGGTTKPNPGLSFNCAQTCTRPTDAFATSTNFSFAFGIVVDPNNYNLMVTEDATAGNRSGRGRAWLSPFVP